MTLPIELNHRIDRHMDLVRQHLGDLPADEKRDILESIETNIHDALATRTQGEPSLEELEAILSEMNSPASYASTTSLVAGSGGPAISARGRILFFAALGILVLLFAAIWLADPFSSHWMDGEESTAPAQEMPKESVPIDPSD